MKNIFKSLFKKDPPPSSEPVVSVETTKQEEVYIVKGKVFDGLYDTIEEARTYGYKTELFKKLNDNVINTFRCRSILYSNGTNKWTVEWF